MPIALPNSCYPSSLNFIFTFFLLLTRHRANDQQWRQNRWRLHSCFQQAAIRQRSLPLAFNCIAEILKHYRMNPLFCTLRYICHPQNNEVVNHPENNLHIPNIIRQLAMRMKTVQEKHTCKPKRLSLQRV